MKPTCPTILLVDDDLDIRETVRAVFETEGYQVVEAEDGSEAVRIVRSNPAVDLVLSDIRMPHKDGVEALREIKDLRPALPVILMTAYAREEREASAFDIGAFTVLAKPVDLDAVLGLIARALKRPATLIVDGPEALRHAFIDSFRSKGHRAIGVETTAEAVDVVASEPVDVAILVLDANRDSVAMLKALHRASARLPIVIVGHAPAAALLEEAARLGVRASIARPDPAHLVRMVGEVRARPLP